MTDDGRDLGAGEAAWPAPHAPASPTQPTEEDPDAETDAETGVDHVIAAAPAAAPSYWQLPPEPSRPEPFGEPDGPPPGAIEIVGRGIDLNVALSREVRRTSIYVGMLYLLAAAPILAIVAVASVQSGGFDWILDGVTTGGGFLTTLGVAGNSTFLFAALCVGAISLDTQMMTLALAGGRLAGRSLGLRDVIGIARRRFWRLVGASFVVGLILIVPSLIVQAVIGRGPGEGRVLLSTLIDLLLSAPFGYVGAAIVLGGLGPLRAIGGSWRIARRRWRLAFVVGVVNTAVSYLSAFALGTGADILVRVATALGLDRAAGIGQVVGILVIAVIAIIAIGSLTVAVSSLSVAPQAIAWIRLGGPTSGLGPTRPDPFDPPPPARLVSLAMLFVIGIEILLALVWLLETR
jgi:hypothetical protein